MDKAAAHKDGKGPDTEGVRVTLWLPSDLHAAASALGEAAPSEFAPLGDLVTVVLRAMTGLPEGGERPSLLALAEGLAHARKSGTDPVTDADIFAALVGRPGYADEVAAFGFFRGAVTTEDEREESRELEADMEAEFRADLAEGPRPARRSDDDIPF